MLSLDELAKKVAAYRDGSLPFEEFYKWYEENSFEVSDPELNGIVVSVEAALSRYFYDNIGEGKLREELAEAARPFVYRLDHYEVRYASFGWGLAASRVLTHTY